MASPRKTDPRDSPDTSGGIACPDCGKKWALTKDSRGYRDGAYIRRRKVCKCGTRYSTVELLAERLDALLAIERLLPEIYELGEWIASLKKSRA